MQDEVREKSVALTIKVGKTGGRLTADMLKWAIRRYLDQSRNPHIRHGKQTVKQLVRQGQGVQNIEITDKNIKSFERVARKYGVDFALKKDPSEGKYLVFFKARDAEALNPLTGPTSASSLPRLYSTLHPPTGSCWNWMPRSRTARRWRASPPTVMCAIIAIRSMRANCISVKIPG